MSHETTRENSFVPTVKSKFERGGLVRIFSVGKEAGVPGTVKSPKRVRWPYVGQDEISQVVNSTEKIGWLRKEL